MSGRNMNISINGETQVLPESVRLLSVLLEQQGYLNREKPGRMVVALNGTVVSARDYNTTPLASGDCIDVLGVITGG